MKRTFTIGTKQDGYVLISTIILVLLITLLALAGISFNSTQTRIATNSSDSQIAFQTAEAALMQVKQIIIADSLNSSFVTKGVNCSSTLPITGAVNGLVGGLIATSCPPTETSGPLWQSANAGWATGLPGTTATLFKGKSQLVGYIVETLNQTSFPGNSLGVSSSNGNVLYPRRITVEASGALNATPQVMLQTIVMD
jgi:Tfp pilus assembly protein PilX